MRIDLDHVKNMDRQLTDTLGELIALDGFKTYKTYHSLHVKAPNHPKSLSITVNFGSYYIREFSVPGTARCVHSAKEAIEDIHARLQQGN